MSGRGRAQRRRVGAKKRGSEEERERRGEGAKKRGSEEERERRREGAKKRERRIGVCTSACASPSAAAFESAVFETPVFAGGEIASADVVAHCCSPCTGRPAGAADQDLARHYHQQQEGHLHAAPVTEGDGDGMKSKGVGVSLPATPSLVWWRAGGGSGCAGRRPTLPCLPRRGSGSPRSLSCSSRRRRTFAAATCTASAVRSRAGCKSTSRRSRSCTTSRPASCSRTRR